MSWDSRVSHLFLQYSSEGYCLDTHRMEKICGYSIYRVIYLYDHVWLQTTSFQGFHSHGFTGQQEI